MKKFAKSSAVKAVTSKDIKGNAFGAGMKKLTRSSSVKAVSSKSIQGNAFGSGMIKPKK